MKKQNCISFVCDANGRQIDFFRWALKTPAVIKKHFDKYIKDWPSLCREWRRVEIYRTPDGLNEEPTPALAWDVMPA